MTFNEYQKLAQRTANTHCADHKLMNGVLGLNGESGEIADIIKKYKYQGHDYDREHLAEEIGDVLWYCAELATAIGMNLEEIARLNITKLQKRYPNGFEADRSINREEYIHK